MSDYVPNMSEETKNDFDTILEWCVENDLIVSFGAKFTEYDTDNDVIYLEDYENADEAVFSLLHECGHFIIQSRDNYSTLYADKLRSQSPTDYFCGFIREERNAWREGYALACSLGLEIDSGAFEALSEACQNQYLNAFQK